MSSNIGETGVKSIRLKGKRIEELPLGTNNEAKEQLVDAIETERLNAIAEVCAKYPTQRIDYLTARINECEANKNNMRKMITDTYGRIQEYQGLVMQCEVRDKMLAELPCAICKQVELEHRGDERHVYEKQDEEALQRFEDVIKAEDESIKEHMQVITLCKQRDIELAALGAKVDG
jgi:hypothetical protein